MPSQTIKNEITSDIEIVTIKITICKNNFVVGMYKSSNLSETNFTTSLETITSKLSNKCEKLILMEYFNITTGNPNLSHSLDTVKLSLLNTDPTFFRIQIF